MTAGMAYEPMNNAGARKGGLIVILNDNDVSIAPPVGAMSAYLSRLITGKPYRSMRHVAKELAKRFPRAMERAARRAEEYARGDLFIDHDKPERQHALGPGREKHHRNGRPGAGPRP